MTKPKIIRLSWNEIDSLTRHLALDIKKSNFEPEVIIGIERGGLIPAVYLSHLLKVRHFQSINIQSTKNDEIRATRERPKIKYKDSIDIVASKRVLIVDDVTNTGVTLLSAKNIISELRASSIRLAVLFIDTINMNEELLLSPKNPLINYIGKKIDAWPVFPWEDQQV